MTLSKRVLIIGGGPSGLAAAYACSKSNLDVVCFESDTVVGGISRTVEYQGFRFDFGGHRFFTKIPAVHELWSKVLEDDFLTRPRLSRIYYNGQFYKYPLQVTDALSRLGVINSLLIGLSYFKSQLFPLADESTFEQWVTNRFGKRLYAMFFKTYTEKVWGMPCTQIRAEWAAQRIKGLSLWSVLTNALKLSSRNSVKSLIEEFSYPKYGPGQMYEKLAEMAIGLGSEIRMKNKVVRLFHKDNRISSLLIQTEDGQVEERGTDFISTMPLDELILSLHPSPPADVIKATQGLRFRTMLTVNLIVDHPQELPDTWIYIHDPKVRVGRVQFFANWSPAMVPSSRQSSLGLEYFCWQGDEIWDMTDKELLEMAKKEVGLLRLADPEMVTDGFVARMKKCYPVYDEQYKRHVEVIKKYLQRFENLQLCGRYGLFKYNNMDHSIYTAFLAAENLQGANNDVWSINTDDEYHEEDASK